MNSTENNRDRWWSLWTDLSRDLAMRAGFDLMWAVEMQEKGLADPRDLERAQKRARRAVAARRRQDEAFVRAYPDRAVPK